MSKLARLAFVGGEENSLCFRGLGFDVYSVNNLESMNKVLPTLRSEGYAVILTEWRFYPQVKSHFEDLKSEALPTILAIPTRESEKGEGTDFINQLVEMALGSSITLQGEE
ncbi:MAG: V/A-type H+/Na+-transporting ATPase subunit [Candidatus Atribacteria bacterium]|nr:V/A-type H+/Na+-transporting ATPase subunit [Candidatus Atribacteria bacterium]